MGKLETAKEKLQGMVGGKSQKAEVKEVKVEQGQKPEPKPKKEKKPAQYQNEKLPELWAIVGKKGNYRCDNEHAVKSDRKTLIEGARAMVKNQWEPWGLTHKVQKEVCEEWLPILAKSGGQRPTNALIKAQTGFKSFTAWAQAKADKYIANPVTKTNHDKRAIRECLIARELYPEAKAGSSGWLCTQAMVDAVVAEFGLKPVTLGPVE